MTKSQNTKNEQQNDLCITNEQLTEQWKQKKLPLGWYFVKDESGKIYYAEYTEWFNVNGWCGNYFEREEEIVEVLAEAPDYIDWRNMVNCACEEHKANKRFIEENAQLKELLKECELWFTGIVGNMNDKNVGEHNRSVPIGNFEHIFKEFSQKINEVLK
jgi:hypothetical protein